MHTHGKKGCDTTIKSTTIDERLGKSMIGHPGMDLRVFMYGLHILNTTLDDQHPRQSMIGFAMVCPVRAVVLGDQPVTGLS